MAASSARRRTLALAIFVVGALIAGLGVGAAFAHERVADAPTAAAAAGDGDDGGLRLDVGLSVDVLGLTVERDVDLDPALVRGADLPGLSVHRDAALENAPVDAQLDLDLATGSHVGRTGTGGGDATTQSASQAVLSPSSEAAVLAAAAFAGAGLLVYFWASLKTAAYKLVVLPLIPLYAHITRAEVFDNRVREQIFEAIKAEPGVSASELSRTTNVSWGTTMYHLEVLEQTRMISSMRDGRYRRYFQNGAGLHATKEALSLLRNPVTERVVETVRTTPGVTQKDLAHALELTPQALHWHLVRLVKAGLVEKRRDGRLVRHFATA